jgi:asparagine synthase (glutamine-hydrolysing)
MCGIFLSICNEKNFHNRQTSSVLEHRGPDSSQEFQILDNKIEFSKGNSNYYGFFNRLSIRGSNEDQMQPIKLNDNKILLYNGEIYNTQFLIDNFKLDVKNKLLDTKVLAEGISKFGIDFLNYADGMFAIVILDNKEKRVSIIRDYFGIKPLYYYMSHKSLIVCSELKPIVKSINSNKISINYDYFINSIKLLDEKLGQTPFNNINKLLPRQVIEFSYNLNEIKRINEKKLISKVEVNNRNQINNPIEIFKNQIEQYSMSDNSYGLLLSSGVDSNALRNLISSEKNNFTYKNKTKILDEITILDKNYNIKTNSVIIEDSEILKNFKIFCDKSYEIEDDLSLAAQMGVYKQISKNKEIKVVFSGQGADEMFFGYDVGVNLFFQDAIKLSNIKALFCTKKIYNFHRDAYWIKKIDQLRNKNFRKLNFNGLRKYFFEIIDGSFKKNKVQFFDLLLKYFDERIERRLPKLLRWEDLSSMHYSIETRLPFLNMYYYNNRKQFNINSFFSKLGNKSFLRKFMIKSNKVWKESYFSSKKLGYSVNKENIFSIANKDKNLIAISNELNLEINSAYNISLMYWASNFNSYINDLKYFINDQKSLFK